MEVAAEKIKKGFGRLDGTFVVWVATEDARLAQVPGRVCIPVRYADGKHGFRFPLVGEEIEGVYRVK